MTTALRIKLTQAPNGYWLAESGDAQTKLYACSKRNCEAILHDFEVFETGWPDHIRHWCLRHIPWRARLKMRLRGDA